MHILTEYGVLAKGSKKGFLNGKHYNREMRCHRVCCEALSILSLERFFESLNDEETVSAFTDVVQFLDLLYASGDFENIERAMQQPSFEKFYSEFNDIITKQSKTNPTFDLWASYLQMSELLFVCSCNTYF